MDTIQRVNLKNLMRSINDENIYNFFYDKNNIISMELKDNNFRVCVNCTYLEFQKGDLLDCIIDTIDKYIVKSNKEVKTYDYKKNLENLRSNLIVKIVDCKNSFDEQNYNNDYLDGRINTYEEILRCIDKVIENKIIREDV